MGINGKECPKLGVRLKHNYFVLAVLSKIYKNSSAGDAHKNQPSTIQYVYIHNFFPQTLGEVFLL